MNSRERLRRCYFHEELDRPGVYFRENYPANDPTYDKVKQLIYSVTDLKCAWDPAWAGPVWEAYSELTETYVEPHTDDFERRVMILHTPAGDLRAAYLRSLTGAPGYQEEHLLKTRADAETYLSLPMPDIERDVAGFFEADRQIGERGIAEAQLCANPGSFVAQLFGSEAFAILSVTDRDIIHALCRRRMKIMVERVKSLLENNVGPYFALMGEEFICPPLHGPKDFHEFNVKYDKPIIDLIHEAGGRVHVHCHGSIKKVFQAFLDMGADVLHPFEPPPMGDITPAEAKAMARDRICLEGNIQIGDMYEKTPEEIRQQTEALIQDVFDDRKGLIVCPTASLYQVGKGRQCLEQCKAMIQTVLDWEP